MNKSLRIIALIILIIFYYYIFKKLGFLDILEMSLMTYILIIHIDGDEK